MVLALVLSQWLTFAHAFQHPALNAADQSCEICLYAQGLDSGAVLIASQIPVPPPAHEAPLAAALPFVPTRSTYRYPIRGPPNLLA